MAEEKKEVKSEEKREWFHLDIHPWVFFISASLIILFVAGAILFQNYFGDFFSQMQNGMSKYAGWFFIFTVNIVLVVCLVVLISRFGSIKLGGPDAEPEFTTMGWFSMLFSAGMGIGLLFYGVAEPMFHYTANPLTQPGTQEAARKAMDITFLHWGLHPWGGIYISRAVVGFFLF